MKTKLKIIIPAIVAIVAVIIAVLNLGIPKSTEADIDSIMETAQTYLLENKYEQAIVEFDKAIKLDPDNADAYLGLARAYHLNGETERAIETLEEGYEITGDPRLKEFLDELTEIISVSETEVTTTETITETTTEAPKTMPELIGLSKDDAAALCEEYNLIFEVNEIQNVELENGIVVNQSVEADTVINETMSVIIDVVNNMEEVYLIEQIDNPNLEKGPDTRCEIKYDTDSRISEISVQEMYFDEADQFGSYPETKLIQYVYTDDNNIEIHISDTSDEFVEKWFVDLKGRTISYDSFGSTHIDRYNDNWQIISSDISFISDGTGEEEKLTTEYSYDEMGQVTEECTTGYSDLWIVYENEYDTDGKLITQTSQYTIKAYTYDENGNMIKKEIVNPDYGVCGINQYSYSDKLIQVDKIVCLINELLIERFCNL